MSSSDQADFENKFSELQAEFRNSLSDTIDEIESLWEKVSNNETSVSKNLHHMLLRLADAGGTYGAVEVSHLARKLDLIFKSLLEKNDISLFLEESKEKVSELFSQLKLESVNWISSDAPLIQTQKYEKSEGSSLVYTLLGDEMFATELILNLQKQNCKFQHFHNLKVIEENCKQVPPSVIIVDEDFSDNNISAIEVVDYLKNGKNLTVPILYISKSNEAKLRLKASRAGADRYFYKPVSMDEIIHSVKGLHSHIDDLPYRVMVIDNDKALLECYDAILTESGINVDAYSEPLKGFDAISTFRPDLLVIDMYMPECSGAELVKMIRQDDRWALIPVIFLSAEQDINNQLEAMALGADDFLTKPVHANKLVATINATAKRARNNVKLNKDLKNSIQESKYQLVTLDEHAIVSVTDVAGRIIHVNDKLCDISGYTRGELMGKNHRILKSDHHDNDFYEELWNTISQGKIWHGVICNYTKNGDEYWVDSTIVPFINDKGKPYKYVSVRTDVTALRENEHRLKRSQDFANIGSWDWNIKTGDLHWSERIWPLFGYDKEITETSYDNFIHAVHPEDRQMVNDAVTNCVEKGEDYDIQHRVIWPNGEVHWMHESGDVTRNKKGEAQHMLGVVQDITSLMEAGIRQKSNNEILEQIVKGVSVDEVLISIIQHTEKMLPGSICSILFVDSSAKYLTDGIAPGLPEFYNKAIDGVEIGNGIGSCGEAAYSGKKVIVTDINEHPNWISFKDLAQKARLRACWSQPFLSSSGSVIGTFAIYFHEPRTPSNKELDLLIELAQFAAITVERNRAQQALLLAKEEAETANRAKSQFLSSMSHELRTPMNAIMGFSQLLSMTKTNPLTDKQQKNVNEILIAGKHLMRLINEVLDLAKIESGHIELTFSKVNLSKVTNESLQLITPLAQKRGIEILLMKNGEEVNVDEVRKKQDFAWIDETRFKQVILNLMSNAVKYNHENGKMIISCDARDEKYFVFSVTDTGPGLNKEQQQQLFKAFNRLGLEQTEIEGTGIGLVITKKIVELMGGEIGLDSEVGMGSTFWVKLPVKQEYLIDKNKHFEYVNENQLNSMENDMTKVDHKRSVLYIEDNPANLRLVEQILSSLQDLHMWSAPEPLLGLELALEHLPDLILLDINLPGMDGYQVLEHLRKQESSKNIPVIAISANAMPKDIKKGLDAGFDGYITKPVNVKELLEVVENKLHTVN